MPAVRKKQPQEVRSRLLKATAEVAAEHGLGAVTIAEVSKRAGVTSGGLFHHFPSKQHLIDELINTCMQEFEDKIDELIAQDPDQHGRFARAYLAASNSVCDCSLSEAQFGNVLMAMSRDPNLSSRWATWTEEKLDQYGAETDPVLGDIIRYASDGLWLESYVMESANKDRRQAVIDRLLELTHQL